MYEWRTRSGTQRQVTTFASKTVSAGVSQGRVVKMTGVDEIINYQRHPDDDFYALLGCDENSSVSYLFILS